MKKLRLLAVLFPMLTSGCLTSGGSATNAVCAELRADLPTYSRADTPQSKAEGARFLTTFAAVCP